MEGKKKIITGEVRISDNGLRNYHLRIDLPSIPTATIDVSEDPGLVNVREGFVQAIKDIDNLKSLGRPRKER